MDHASFIVEVIDRAREERGMPSYELARRARIDEEHMRRVFRRERGLKAEELVRLCFVLKLPLESLIPQGVVQKRSSQPRQGESS